MSTCQWRNQNGVQCGQPSGHYAGHGNGFLTTPRDLWHDPQARNEKPTLALGASETGPPFMEPPALPGEPKCFWCGALSGCVLRLGHTGPHRESLPEANT